MRTQLPETMNITNHAPPEGDVGVAAQPALHLVSLGECLVEFSREESGLWRTAFAGDAINTLFYAARLGLRTGFISAVGDDLFTSMILSGIEREGIDASLLLRLPGGRNGIYFIELDNRGEYTFHFWRENSAATETLLRHDPDRLIEYIARSRFFLLTGVTLAVMKDRRALFNLLSTTRDRTTIVLDTNYRARLWGSAAEYRRQIEEVLEFTDIYLPSRSDLHAVYPGSRVEEALEKAERQGVGTIVMKAGGEGCGVWRNGTLTMLPPDREIRVVDSTGAGDAFNAGFLAGLARGYDDDDACALARTTAERVLTARGAIDPTFTEQ